jgi:sulfhydrogenase subunit beta (sulfur reductase)
MDTAFISKLRPLLSAVAETMNVYVPRKVGEHFVCAPYDADGDVEPELNDVRMCTPLKEFLLPLRERAAAMPEPARPTPVQPFAVFGLKPCDLRSAEILDRVFLEEGYEDPFYAARRENLFTITADCSAPGETCFCHLLGGKPYAEEGFDLNVSRLADGYVLQSGSARGRAFLFSHAELFGDVPDPLLAERAERREEALRQAARAQEAIPVEMPLKELVERGQDSDSFDQEARTCVECQGCTRICPTCHCFYLYDTKQQDYFAKMKMWDSCMRIGYAGVAGGANPRKGLGDRLRHRFMHKFVWFPDRYGTEMCVGCGRCIDAETGDVDVRRILRRLNDEVLDSGRTTKAAK